MPNTPSIVIVKTITYRGIPEEYSNKYHFSGTVPTTDAGWKALADAIIAQEKTMFATSTTFTSAYGYAAGVAASVWQINYADPPNTVVTGTLTGTYNQAPGDVAFWVRWATGARGTTGKPIFLRKYFHGAAISTSNGDTIFSGQRTAALAYAAKMVDGTLPGGFKVCRPQGGDGGVVKVPTFLTTRTLKRRGADPS